MVECYVDDLIFESSKKINHLEHLRIVFDKLCRPQLNTNLLKVSVRCHHRRILRVCGLS